MLADSIITSPAVAKELDVGASHGIDVPDLATLSWMHVHLPRTPEAVSSTGDLGPGETEVIALAMERRDAIAVLDDRRARQTAEALALPLTGTLGLLLDFKSSGRIPATAPFLDQLETLGFRLADRTRRAVLEQAGEAS